MTIPFFDLRDTLRAAVKPGLGLEFGFEPHCSGLPIRQDLVGICSHHGSKSCVIGSVHGSSIIRDLGI